MRFLTGIFNGGKGSNGQGGAVAKAAGAHAVRPSVWAVGSGKGGVGKSLIASNMGVFLAGSGRKVLLVDADLGSANLHTIVGDHPSPKKLSGFIKGEFDDLGSAIGKTSFEGLDLVSGARDSLDVANLNGTKVMRLAESIRKAGYDHVILDLGPGTHNNMLELFLAADERVIVLTPEPTAVENAYRFLKCVLLRRMRKLQDQDSGGRLRGLLQKILYDGQGLKNISITELVEELASMDRLQGEHLRKALRAMNISIIVNQARTPGDRLLGDGIQRACRDYFGIEVGTIGHISYGESVVESVRRRTPLALLENSEQAREIEAIVGRLLDKGRMAGTP